MPARATVLELYPRLIKGDIGVLSSFCERATVDSPLGGKQLPPEFVAETRAWLDAHEARVDDVRTTETDGRVIHEITLWLEFDGNECELPIMLVADIADGCIRDLRIYHSTWPLYGTHEVRHGVLPYYNLAERPAEPVGSYHEAIGAGDAAAADATFEPDGVVREPSGSRYSHSGADRTGWYERILADGGITLHLGSITDDGTTVVFEFLADKWGRDGMPAQAGAAAYTRGASGKISSARIYDDVTPPAAITG
jgi:ketosteroid isomerase-like protein